VAAGTVLELWRYPVKSMGGEPLKATHVDATGVIGDRAHALTHEHKGAVKPLTAREAPAILAWRAGYPFAPDSTLKPGEVPPATVTAPDGRNHRWDDPRLRQRLAEELGRPVELRREPDGSLHDLPQTLLVTFEASRRALEEELGTPLDLRRFRPNLHVGLDADPWQELQWEGRTLILEGGVRLRFLHPCERCVIPTIDPDTREKAPQLLRHLNRAHETLFGMNAQVVNPGRIRVGARAAVLVGLQPGRVAG